ncbi:MAG: hypothetical protein DA408_19590 [Bacteroidetes bacterium]|nr:MAG: hypothetical protein C7N36_09310 [Bacteroidota bacterium]PTM08898.1 MAG: hypothetical protein DA408_19590 [Bacteroidota bacterium]
MPQTTPPFKLCLTMAGAVSAGAYTGGVIDYLLETLELWQRAKDENNRIKAAFPDTYLKNGYDPSVPMHEVQIEVVSGASAGGITSMLTFLSLLEGIHLGAPGVHRKEDNKLYQAWVAMADTPAQDTLLQLLSNDDLADGQVLESLLNSDALERIADVAIQETAIGDYPAYVAKDLDLFLTVSNLRGIRYKVGFTGNAEEGKGTQHYITTHSGFFRYRIETDELKPGIPPSVEDLYYVLAKQKTADQVTLSRADLDNLKNAALSTAAFPIGLKSRVNTIPRDYLDRYKKYLFSDPECVTSDELPDPVFKFRTVDGGLLNNEPFGYTTKILNEKIAQANANGNATPGAVNHAVLMIDPFPNFNKTDDFSVADKSIGYIAQKVFGALRNQVMFKQDDIFAALNENQDTRFLIAPIRWIGDKKEQDCALGCGGLAGFSGFLSRDLREHDFALGRKNCQSFLRYHFAIKTDKCAEKLNQPVTQEAMDRFGFFRPAAAPRDIDAQKQYFPIIPDMKLVVAFNEQIDEAYGAEGKLPQPVFPTVSMAALEGKYKTAIMGRIKGIRQYFLQDAKWYIRLGAKLFGVDRKVYTRLIAAIEDGLVQQGLVKPKGKK